jgi:MFS family permease
LLLYNSLVYTAFYDVTASMPYLFGKIYGFNDLQIGLCFIPFGIGCLIAPILGGRLLDWNFRRLAVKHGFPVDKKRATDLKDFPLEQARIQVAWPLVVVGDAALLCYGWVMHMETNLAAPLVLLFFIGLCLTGSFNCNSVMLVDLYPLSPSTATAANNLVRCFMGAGGTAIIIIMIDSMGRGWCFTFIASVVMLFSPILWILRKYGQGWRNARTERLEELAAKKQRAEQEKDREISAYEAQVEK